MWSLVANPCPFLRTLWQISYIKELPGISPKHPDQDSARRNHPKKQGEKREKEGGRKGCVFLASSSFYAPLEELRIRKTTGRLQSPRNPGAGHREVVRPRVFRKLT